MSMIFQTPPPDYEAMFAVIEGPARKSAFELENTRRPWRWFCGQVLVIQETEVFLNSPIWRCDGVRVQACEFDQWFVKFLQSEYNGFTNIRMDNWVWGFSNVQNIGLIKGIIPRQINMGSPKHIFDFLWRMDISKNYKIYDEIL